jgi:hypothetical protein
MTYQYADELMGKLAKAAAGVSQAKEPGLGAGVSFALFTSAGGTLIGRLGESQPIFGQAQP